MIVDSGLPTISSRVHPNTDAKLSLTSVITPRWSAMTVGNLVSRLTSAIVVMHCLPPWCARCWHRSSRGRQVDNGGYSMIPPLEAGVERIATVVRQGDRERAG